MMAKITPFFEAQIQSLNVIDTFIHFSLKIHCVVNRGVGWLQEYLAGYIERERKGVIMQKHLKDAKNELP